jgi:adenylate cyclase class 1
VLKKQVHRGAEAPGHVSDIDPYALMFDELIAHYKTNGQPEDVLILQQCLYLKCACKLSEPLDEGQEANFKRKILASYAKRWGWSRKTLYHLDNQQEWSFKQRVQLSTRIHRFLIKCYRRISKELSNQQQSLDQKDMTVLGRRLSTFYGKKTDKIEFLRSAFDVSLYCEKVTVALKQLKNGGEVWSVYAGDLLSKSGIIDESQKMAQASSAIGLMMWCVSSKVIDAKSTVYLDYNYGEISELDLNDLVRHLCKYLPAVKVSTLPRSDLLAPERIKTCLAIVNFPTLRQKAVVEDVAVLYTTTWGETFLKHGEEVLDNLWYELREVTPQPACHVMVPRGNQQARIIGQFMESSDISFNVLY